MSSVLKSAFWRQAGMNYMQYLGIASRVVRLCLKEPAKSKALAREGLFFNRSTPKTDKVPVSSLFTPVK